ncbi:hypothetical protein TH8_19745 [Thalassospira profundimaris]|nr:hypothetical protein TH8_19745 [Thalassospira profundimaris]
MENKHVGRIMHIDHGKVSLAAAVSKFLSDCDVGNAIEIRAMHQHDELDDQPIWDRHGNCLRTTNHRVVVCHCAACGGK